MASNDVVINVLTDVQASIKAVNKLGDSAVNSLQKISKEVGFTQKSFSSFVGNLGSQVAIGALNKLKGGVKVKSSSAPKVNIGKAPDLTKKIL